MIFRHPIKLNQSSLGKTPEGLNPINVLVASGKFIMTMINVIMFIVPHIHQAIITTPAIRMDDTFVIDFPAYNSLQGLFAGIRNNFSVHIPRAFEDAKDNRFARGTTNAFTGISSGTEVRFVHFNSTLDSGQLL